MKRILLGAVVLAATAGAVVSFGLVPFAADEPHAEAVRSLIAFARERSIARAAADIVAPANLVSPERIRRGAGNYEAMCAGCHLSPGAADTEIRKGLYPQPPNLTVKVARSEGGDAQRFWIVKHGVKGSGMPAWAKGGMEDAAIWDIVAFIGVLPTLTLQQYRQQVEASGGHSHGGLDHEHPHAQTSANGEHRDDAHGHDHEHHGAQAH